MLCLGFLFGRCWGPTPNNGMGVYGGFTLYHLPRHRIFGVRLTAHRLISHKPLQKWGRCPLKPPATQDRTFNLSLWSVVLLASPPLFRIQKGGSLTPFSPVLRYQIVNVPSFVYLAIQPQDVLIVNPKRHHLLTARPISSVRPSDSWFLLLFWFLLHG